MWNIITCTIKTLTVVVHFSPPPAVWGVQVFPSGGGASKGRASKFCLSDCGRGTKLNDHGNKNLKKKIIFWLVAGPPAEKVFNFGFKLKNLVYY